MHQSINLYQFRDAFATADRLGNFSYEGLGILFEYMEQYESDTGESVELDVIALCCDYTEESFREAADNHGIDISGCADDDGIRETVLAHLDYETVVCGHTDDIVVYACF